MAVIQEFAASGFPDTIGAIDGSHIKINRPTEHERDYVNRKGFHSINLLVSLAYF